MRKSTKSSKALPMLQPQRIEKSPTAAFVAGTTSSAGAKRGPKTPWPREGFKRQWIYIDEEAERRLRIAALEREQHPWELLSEILLEALGQHPAQGQGAARRAS